MRLLFVADGRSPIARNWIMHFVERGDEVYLASTFDCSVDFPLAGLELTPVAYSGMRKRGQGSATTADAIGLRMAIRHFLGPLTIRRAAERLRSVTMRVRPDLVHALRIPYEGMLAADAYVGVPLVASVWGNDFTLHASSNWLMRHYTSWTLQVAQGLHADCQRDIRMSKEWGFDPAKPTLLIPGNGGVKTEVFYAPSRPVDAPIVVNPRGNRAYVRNDVFFQAIPMVLAKRPDAKFVCVSQEGERGALRWIQRLNIAHATDLLPTVPHVEMARIFRGAQVVVSPTVHDGTPNSLLEGMACGCLPIAGDLESIREWITPGQNGLLVDATEPRHLARAIVEGLENADLRHKAAGLNRSIITQRADYAHCMAEAARFYQRVISRQ